MHPIKLRILEASIKAKEALFLAYENDGYPTFYLAETIDDTQIHFVAETQEDAFRGSYPVSPKTIGNGGRFNDAAFEASWVAGVLHHSALEYLITWSWDYDANTELNRVLFFSEEDAVVGLVLLES